MSLKFKDTVRTASYIDIHIGIDIILAILVVNKRTINNVKGEGSVTQGRAHG